MWRRSEPEPRLSLFPPHQYLIVGRLCIRKVNALTLTIASETVPLVTDIDGVIHVGETRVTLDTVIAAFLDGATAEEISQQYPSLDLADVYSVIAYYLRQRAEIDTYLQRRREQAEKIREENESRFDPSGIRDRLLARRASRSL